MGRVLTLETVGLFKPDGFLNLLRVGLISTLYLPCRRRGATTGVGSTARNDLTRRSRELGPLIVIKNTCLIRDIITAVIDATWRHHARRSRGAGTTGD